MTDHKTRAARHHRENLRLRKTRREQCPSREQRQFQRVQIGRDPQRAKIHGVRRRPGLGLIHLQRELPLPQYANERCRQRAAKRYRHHRHTEKFPD